MISQVFEDETGSGSVFRDESCLTSSHLPESVVGREHQAERIADALRPLIRHKRPKNMLLYGPAGVGKTTTVQYVFENLADETQAEPVFINCWKYNTRPSLLTELLIQLGYPAPRKGKPVDELLSKLREWLEKNRCVALALDEFDQLDAQTEIVYDLQQLNASTQHKIGLVLISNRSPTSLQLDPRSVSRLSYRTLGFEGYDVDTLERILERRCERAFEPGAVEDAVIGIIAEKVTKMDGDCRQALELLRQAGREAERQGEHTVARGHVEAVME